MKAFASKLSIGRAGTAASQPQDSGGNPTEKKAETAAPPADAAAARAAARSRDRSWLHKLTKRDEGERSSAVSLEPFSGILPSPHTAMLIPPVGAHHVRALIVCGLIGDDFKRLRSDINKVLECEPGSADFKHLNKEFVRRYGGVLTPADFRKERDRSLLRGLVPAIDQHLAQAHLESVQYAYGSAAFAIPSRKRLSSGRPLAFKGFQAERTEKAFKLVEEASRQVWAVGAPHSGDAGTSAGVVRVAAAGKDRELTPEERKRWDKRRAEERKRLEDLNKSLEKWFDDHGLMTPPNTGTGLNCQIYALLQHASGDYDNPEPAEGADFRNFIDESGMLHADAETLVALTQKIKELYGVDMNVHVVQTAEDGTPVILPGPKTGEHNVVLWHQGEHYVAVVAKEEEPSVQA